MKKNVLLLFLSFIFYKCTKPNPGIFTEKAVSEIVISTNNKELSIKEILQQHKNKKILINLWASWCKDCLENISKLQKLQEDNKNVVYLFFSLDRNISSWKKGVKHLQLQGEHYFLPSGWNGSFSKFLHLNWIPRYLVINTNGSIVVFNATTITDTNITKSLLP